jgi:hypothetical protein
MSGNYQEDGDAGFPQNHRDAYGLHLPFFQKRRLGRTDGLTDVKFRSGRLREASNDCLNDYSLQFSEWKIVPLQSSVPLPPPTSTGRATRRRSGSMLGASNDASSQNEADKRQKRSTPDPDPFSSLSKLTLLDLFNPSAKKSQVVVLVPDESVFCRTIMSCPGKEYRAAWIGQVQGTPRYKAVCGNMTNVPPKSVFDALRNEKESISENIYSGKTTDHLKILIAAGGGRAARNLKAVYLDIPLSDFLLGSIQIWGHLSNRMRDIKDSVHEVCLAQDENTRNQMLSFYLDEFRGDLTSTTFLHSRYYFERCGLIELTLKNRKRGDDSKMTEAVQTKLEETTFKKEVTEVCNKLVQQRIRETVGGFVELNRPVLDKADMVFMHNQLLTQCPYTYKLLMEKLKTKHERKEDLRIRILLEFFRDQRLHSNRNLTDFALVLQYAIDAQGSGGIAQDVLQYDKRAASDTKLAEHQESLLKVFNESFKFLKDEDNVLICWDNFQKFIAMKYLRAGSSVHAMHATVRFAREINVPPQYEPDNQTCQLRDNLIYVDQPIPFPPHTFPFEWLEYLENDRPRFCKMLEAIFCGEQGPDGIWSPLNTNTLIEVFRQLLVEKFRHSETDHQEDHPVHSFLSEAEIQLDIDNASVAMIGDKIAVEDVPVPSRPKATFPDAEIFLESEEETEGNPATEKAGKRTDWYKKVLDIAATLQGMKKYLVSDSVKEEHEGNAMAQSVLKVIQSNRKLCVAAGKFQERCVATWNPFSTNVTKVCPMRASEYKESSIEGNGLVFSENSEMAGFLNRKKDGNDVSFESDPRLKDRKYIVAGDVLSTSKRTECLFQFRMPALRVHHKSEYLVKLIDSKFRIARAFLMANLSHASIISNAKEHRVIRMRAWMVSDATNLLSQLLHTRWDSFTSNEAN